MSLDNSRSLIRKLKLAKKPRHNRSETSAVTTAWGVNWNEDFIARDIMQNFFDANRDQLEKVLVTAKNQTVTITAPARYELERLFYLGSDKKGDDIGQYGEGFKVAATCLLRDHGVTPVAVSGTQVLCMRIADEPVTGAAFFPLVYDFFVSDKEHDGTKIVLPGCSAKLVSALSTGMDHFLYHGNQLVGAERWSSWKNEFVLYDSHDKDGYVFYRNLKRGEILDVPIVLVINKEYKSIENKIKKDRDRNAFGGELMEIFYRTFAKQLRYSRDAILLIVEAANNCWERGHPLLAEIARTAGYGGTILDQDTSRMIFDEKYFARSKARDPKDELAYRQLEKDWEKKGRRPLPGYFEQFGVISAKQHFADVEEKARQEALKTEARVPTQAETASITLLTTILGQLAPEIMEIAKGNTQYTVGVTETVLGELRNGRGSRSRVVYLAEKVFVTDFAEALAVFLHEHAHIFGYDGSRAFTDALTELLEMAVRHRKELDKFEKQWIAAAKVVAKERRSRRRAERDTLKERLSKMKESDLRQLIDKVPPVVLNRLLSNENSGPNETR